ncbi:MAG: hypothetical protein AB1805_00020 [Nitrospirota bacterium]
MTIILAILGALMVAFIIYLGINARRGHRIAVHLDMFERLYDKTFADTKSKNLALSTGLMQFKICPRFSQLTSDDIDSITSILAPLSDPKAIISRIVLQMDSKRAVRALKDADFLADIAKIYEKQPSKELSDAETEILEEKAEDLLASCRTLLGILQPTLYRKYPELLTLSDDTKVTFFGTIAFVWTACVRLHFDVSEERRTAIERLVQDELEKWHPDALNEYVNLHRFASERLEQEPDREERGHLVFALAALWAVAKITNEDQVTGKGIEIAETLAALFLEETTGYWKSKNV